MLTVKEAAEPPITASRGDMWYNILLMAVQETQKALRKQYWSGELKSHPNQRLHREGSLQPSLKASQPCLVGKV